MGMSLRAYAAHRKERGLPGGSDAAVRKAIKADRIPVLADGTVDPAAADAAWAGNSDPRKQRGPEAAAQPVYGVEDADGPAPVIVASPTAGMDAKAAATFNDVRIAREKVKLKKELREDKVADKLLVERAPANRFVFELALSFRGEVESWPDVLGPELAAEFGVSEHAMVQALRDRFRARLIKMAEKGTDVPVPN